MGFTSASWSAYSTRNGVMSPGVSAGSKKVGAREKWTAQIIWPAGASERDGGCARAVETKAGGPSTIVATSTPEKTPERHRVYFMAVASNGSDSFATVSVLLQAVLGPVGVDSVQIFLRRHRARREPML